MNLRLPGEGWGEEIVREFGMDMYTLLYFKWVTNKDLLSTQSYVAAWMGGEFGGEWICVYVSLSTGNYHNIINWLYFNIKLKVLKNKKQNLS